MFLLFSSFFLIFSYFFLILFSVVFFSVRNICLCSLQLNSSIYLLAFFFSYFPQSYYLISVSGFCSLSFSLHIPSIVFFQFFFPCFFDRFFKILCFVRRSHLSSIFFPIFQLLLYSFVSESRFHFLFTGRKKNIFQIISNPVMVDPNSIL